MISVCCRIVCGLLMLILLVGCSSEESTPNTSTSHEELAAFVDQNPSFGGPAENVAVPASANPKDKKTIETLGLGN